MKIRKFERADLPQVLELCREVRQYHTDILGGYFAEQDDAFEQSGFLATLEDDRMTALVAEEGEEINGYLLAEKKYSPYLREPNVVHISNIGVKKGLRGKGIGKKLMDALFEMCKAEGVDERVGLIGHGKRKMRCRDCPLLCHRRQRAPKKDGRTYAKPAGSPLK